MNQQTSTTLPPVLTRYGPTGYPEPPAAGAPAPVIPAAARPPAATTKRGSSRRTRLTAAVIVTLLTAGSAYALGLGQSTSPEEVVRAAFDALTARDATRLSTVCDASPLCTPTGLATGYEPPHNVRIRTAPAQDSDERDVTVVYTITGTEHTHTLTLRRHRQGLLSHGWTIVTDIGARLDVHGAAQPTVRVAGITVDTNPANNIDKTKAGTVWAPPGAYAVTVDGNPMFEPVRTTVIVAGGQTPTMTLAPTLRPTLQPQIEQQIQARLTACAQQRNLRPDIDTNPATPGDCPFRYDAPYTVIDAPAWTIDRQPAITLTVTDGPGVAVSTTAPGSATVSYRWSTDIVEPRRWNTASSTEPITIGGRIAVIDGVATWRP